MISALQRSDSGLSDGTISTVSSANVIATNTSGGTEENHEHKVTVSVVVYLREGTGKDAQGVPFKMQST